MIKRRDPYRLRQLRQIVQLAFLSGFAFLLVKALLGRVLGSGIPLLITTLATAMLTLVLGRVWCGWVCPVNTVLDRIHFKAAIERGARLSERWRLVKYVLLLLVLAAALLGFLRPLSDWIANLSPEQGASQLLVGGGVVILALAGIVALESAAEHFWCRYLCPLGGAVALLSKLAPMRRIVHRKGPAHCNDCSVCVDACPLGAIDPRRGFVNDPGECSVCIDCLAACTSSSNGFRFSRPLGGQR